MSEADFSAARALDAEDPLRELRAQFHFPKRPDGTPGIYLCGHSLGLQPKRAAQLLQEELNHWALRAVEGHFRSPRPWVSYHERLTPGLAMLTGASPHEVVAMNSLTVNLHLMLASFYRPRGGRHKILMEKRAFSSDRYAVLSQLQWHGFGRDAVIEVSASEGAHSVTTEQVCAAIERSRDELALVLLPGVQYLSGQLFDMETITACAHRAGCVVGYDLAHAIGNVPLRLHDWEVDFAVWCSYKYLNAGPGAIGGAFVHERHSALPRLSGWWGHRKDNRFEMPADFQPIAGAEGWQLSNPPILAAAPLLASLELFEQAGILRLREKSQRLTQLLEDSVRAKLGQAVEILTPPAPHRGAQLSIRLSMERDHAQSVYERLIERDVMCDWREPDVIRVAPAPLYNNFADVCGFVNELVAAVGAQRPSNP